MRFTIRPNTMHPAWPHEPDPADLASARRLAKSEKEVRERALTATRGRVVASYRVGAGGMTDNLDWLNMVRALRVQLRTMGQYEATVWIDGGPPQTEAPFTVVARTRLWQPWSGCRYCIVTFDVEPGSDTLTTETSP